ncbi:coil containing protein [Vibrio phage 1.050.O._10N.286.48.A6]|nr:coil containing protein [Vibrio phage 1.050.O._10N.286.48.A6]
MATDSEIVELVIDAKNLTSDELNKAADDVNGLGAAARKAEGDLSKLKIKKDTIQSYEQVSASVKVLRKELADAEVSYENLDKATKKNKEATDEQRASVKLAKKDLNDLKVTLKDQEREYNALSKSVKAYGVTTKNTKDKQAELSAEIVEAKSKVKSLTDEYQKQAKSLKTKVTAEKESVKVTEAHAAALKENEARQQKAAAAAKKAAEADAIQATEAKRVTAALVQYEKQLSELNREKKAGTASSAQYIRGEAALRKELKLTEGQVKTSRQAIQADSAEKGNAAKNTDVLTSATRRLAQVYTVLLAAQKAVQAVGSGVKEYGELEAAITKVEKTTGLARDTVVDMADQLRELGEDVTPTTTNEMLRFAEVAGQLGTKSTEDILNLVSASDALERSTNLAGDEAAELLARILQMTSEGIPSIHNLSSSVVALGNDFAVSEQDVVHMTKEIISGTREINLGSAAAAAFGTTLKELGQPAERSRTAIQRLSGAIKKATIEGGDDLERLSEVTGLTADEIEKNLGERPEEVLLSFLQGLNRVDEAGGQVSTVLKRMGIDGTEATGVLSVLAGGTERLAEAMALSNKQFEAGDAHIKEAVKSYADQESALGRLSNKFTNLTAKIGEAFSDETDQAVRGLGDALNETEGDVVSLMEYLPELVEGLVEVVDTMNDLASIFSDEDEGIGAIQSTLELAALGTNVLTIAMRQLSIDVGEVTIAASLMYNAFQPISELQIDTKFITDVQLKMEIAKSAIVQDNIDIQNSIKRMEGESSIAYEDLIAAASRYGLAINTLSAEQQAAIELSISKNGYISSENDQYRKLTAAIVRANRELEIEAELKKRATAATVEKNEADKTVIDTTEAQVLSQGKVNVSLAEYNTIVAKVVESQALAVDAQNRGIISDESADAVTIRLTESLNKYNVVVAEGEVIAQQQIATTEDYLTARTKLDEQHALGLLTDRELVIAQQDLSASFSESANAIHGAVEASAELSRAQAELNNKIVKSEGIIRDLNTQLNAGNLATNEAIEIKAKLAKQESQLNDLKAEQLRLNEIENATYPQLVALQREYSTELENINRKFKAGTITKAQYESQTRGITQALNELNGVLGENSDELDINTKATQNNSTAKFEQAEASKAAVSYMSLELKAASALNQTYDKSGDSVNALNTRYRELQTMITKNGRVTTGWLANLAKTWNAVFKQEQAVISNTKSMRKWIAEVESGTLSLDELNKRAKYADTYFRALSGNQLTPLLNAIDKAKRDFEDLTGVIDSTIDDVQDRLDLALGNASAITKRQFEREIAEMQELIDQAESYGNRTLVTQLQGALRDLKKVQKLEYDAEYGGSTQTTNQPAQSTNSAQAETNYSPQSTSNESVTLQLAVGDKSFATDITKTVLAQLMAEIDKQKGVGN